MHICIVVGNPKAGSRTLAAAEALAGELAGPADSVSVIDLAEHAGALFSWPSETVDALSAQAAACDVLVVASPTYKATYTGLLKAFLDRYSSGGLSGVCAIPLMTGAARDHAMAPEVNLRPLLVELGATVPTSGLYIDMTQIDALEDLLTGWISRNAGLVRGVVAQKVSA